MNRSGIAVAGVFGLSACVAGCFPPVETADASDTVLGDTVPSGAADSGAPSDTSVIDSTVADTMSVDTDTDTDTDTGTLDTTLTSDTGVDTRAADTVADTAPDTDGDTSVVDTVVTDTSPSCDPACEHGGTCVTGTCDCSGTSYSGPTCGTLESTCPTATHSCIPRVDDPWTGPVALSPTAMSCGGLFPTLLGTLHQGLEPGSASCPCTCSGSPSVTCPSELYVASYYSVNCPQGQSGGGGHGAIFGDCYTYDSGQQQSASFFLDFPDASCAVGSLSPAIDSPSWESDATICAAIAGGAHCANAEDVCIPRLLLDYADAAYCVFTPGDAACPAGYPDRGVWYASADDTRECPSACSCTASEATCEIGVERWATASCDGSPNATSYLVSGQGTAPPWDGLCEMNGGLYKAARAVLPVQVSNPGRCLPEAVTATGGVESAGLHTVCCR